MSQIKKQEGNSYTNFHFNFIKDNFKKFKYKDLTVNSSLQLSLIAATTKKSGCYIEENVH